MEGGEGGTGGTGDGDGDGDGSSKRKRHDSYDDDDDADADAEPSCTAACACAAACAASAAAATGGDEHPPPRKPRLVRGSSPTGAAAHTQELLDTSGDGYILDNSRALPLWQQQHARALVD
jgi:hypothetical protein